MDLSRYHLRLHVGQRNIKTALAATLCALVYFLVERNPTFACIGAIFGLGSDMDNSRLNGGNRFFGTIIGGVLGMLLFRLYIVFYPDGSMHLPMLLFLFAGVVALILTSVIKLFKGAVKDWPTRIIYAIVLLLSAVGAFLPMPAGVLGAVLGYLCSPVVLVILSGIAGLCIRMAKGGKGK